MIIEGGSYSSGGWWAKHVQNEEKNELIQVMEVQGLDGERIEDFFQQMRAMSKGTKCTNYFEQWNIDLPKHERLTDEQWREAHEVTRKNHDLEGQPFFRVRHTKRDEQGNLHVHEHCFTSRIDPELMKAIPDSLTAQIREQTSRELEEKFGLTPGRSVLTPDRDGPRPERRPKKWERFRGAESGLDPAAIGKELAAIKERCDNGQSFKTGMEAAGAYVLARGDSRNFVVVDLASDEHSLGRRLGIKAAELRDFMKDVNPATLPSVEEARTLQRMHAAEIEQRKASIGRYDDIRPEQVQQAAREAIRPMFETAAERTSEPATPIYDRDAANRTADEKIIEAAIAGAQEARQRPEQAKAADRDAPAARGPYADLPTPEPDAELSERTHQAREKSHSRDAGLGKTAGDIRMAWSLSQSASELQEGLAARGLGLALASADEARASERIGAFAKEIGNYARIVREGEIVAVDGFGHVYRLDERTTGQQRPEIEGRLAGLDRAELSNIADTKAAMREAALADWVEQQRQHAEQIRLPSRIESRIAECADQARRDVTIGTRDNAGQLADRADALADRFKPEDEQKIKAATVRGWEAFETRLAEAGIAITRVQEADLKGLSALREQEGFDRASGLAHKPHHFAADLIAGDLAAVTRAGDVYRINPDKLGDAKQYIAPELPGVIETRAKFEIEREQTSALWKEQRAESSAARADFAAEREGQHQAAETARNVHQVNQNIGEGIDTGFKAASRISKGFAKVAESILGIFSFFGGGEPKLTPMQAELKERADEERAEARATHAAAQEKADAVDWAQFERNRQQQYEEFMNGRSTAREKQRARDDDEYERERGRER